MIQLVNMTSQFNKMNQGHSYIGGVNQFIQDCDCEGIETIYDGTDGPSVDGTDMVVGYHLIFYTDWLDFWREDNKALDRKFGSSDIWQGFYLGSGRTALIDQLRADLARAESFEAQYVVFHVSDVSIEEGYTYEWLHTDEEIIDAAAELINLLLDGQNYSFEFLMENLHWPGFTFTKPHLTRRLLDQVNYQKKGIMLDVGHLMCTNLEIKDQADGCRYVHQLLDEHGELCTYIHGVHLHQSVTGEYVKHSLKNMLTLKKDYYDRFAQSYEHVLQIDTHQPISCSEVHTLIDRIAPKYLVHEISAKTMEEKLYLTKIQQHAIQCEK